MSARQVRSSPLAFLWVLLAVCATLPLFFAKAARGGDPVAAGASASASASASSAPSGSASPGKAISVWFSGPVPSGSASGAAPAASSAAVEDLALDQPLSGESINVLKFPQMKSVHLRMWAPRTDSSVAQCVKESREVRAIYSDIRKTAETLKKTDPNSDELNTLREELSSEIGYLKGADEAPNDILVVLELLRDARDPSDKTRLLKLLNQRLPPIENEVDQETKQKIHNLRSDFATWGETITLPALQYEVAYCFEVSGVDGNNHPHHGFLFQRIPWPLNAGAKSWWTDRYVMPSVGLGVGQDWARYGDGLTVQAKPFLLVGAHITPWPSDRRIPWRDRVHSYWQRFHLEVGAAVTDPWQGVTLSKPFAVSALVVGAGVSWWDNVVGLSASAVMGEASYHLTDASGIGHDRTQMLVYPSINLTTQADVIGIVGGLVQGKLP